MSPGVGHGKMPRCPGDFDKKETLSLRQAFMIPFMAPSRRWQLTHGSGRSANPVECPEIGPFIPHERIRTLLFLWISFWLISVLGGQLSTGFIFLTKCEYVSNHTKPTCVVLRMPSPERSEWKKGDEIPEWVRGFFLLSAFWKKKRSETSFSWLMSRKLEIFVVN